MSTKHHKPNTTLLSALIFLSLNVVLTGFTNPVKAGKIPDQFIGNWIGDKDNLWKYGLYETFAVIECDFWTYTRVELINENSVQITAHRNSQNLVLVLNKLASGALQIRAGQLAGETFHLKGRESTCYFSEDKRPFQKPDFHVDSVTIIGYYRNLDRGKKGFIERFFDAPFEVAVSDFLAGSDVKYYSDIDSLGRFKLKIPVINTQELLLDWKRIRVKAVAEPGDTLFLFADINDFLPQPGEENSYQAYVDRPKQVIFMGEHARLNNEIAGYKDPWESVDKNQLKSLDDMQFLKACEQIYNGRSQTLNTYLGKHPWLSLQFITYKQKQEKYSLAFDLMQRRFASQSGQVKQFSPEYLTYITTHFPLDDELDFTLLRNFYAFVNDYISYHNEMKLQSPVLFEEIRQRLAENKELDKATNNQIREIALLSKTSQNDPKAQQAIDDRARLLNSKELITKTAEMIQNEKYFLDFSTADSLIRNRNLMELWAANRFCYWFDVLRKPLSIHQQTLFRQKVSNSDLRKSIDRMQSHYSDVAKRDLSYQASLKNTKHLEEYNDAEMLFGNLIKPYRGKVIYLDFWGTWCSGCRKDLQQVSKLKEALKKEGVIFMYLANRSPETTWRNLIKEMNLTGDNIVHYRLEDAKQAMVERKLGVTNFPTYMLIDKNGKIVNSKANSPNNIPGALAEIRELLSKPVNQ